MKLLFILGRVMVVGCGAADAPEISTKVFERDRDNDGQPDLRVETISRGTNAVLRVRSSRKGNRTAVSRSVMVGGELVMIETDDDGDGLFETLAAFLPGRQEMEVFSRSVDGSIKPTSAVTLEAYKKQNAAVVEFWDKTLGSGMSDEKLPELIQETQEKIRNAEREKVEKEK